MKITDKMRLDWMQRREVEILTEFDYMSGELPTPFKAFRICTQTGDVIQRRSIRQAIDAAIRAEKAGRK
jgi:hypothetical protein